MSWSEGTSERGGIRNGQMGGATVLGYDRSHDVVLLLLTVASGLRTSTTGASGFIALGDAVVAVDNAQGAANRPRHVGDT